MNPKQKAIESTIAKVIDLITKDNKLDAIGVVNNHTTYWIFMLYDGFHKYNGRWSEKVEYIEQAYVRPIKRFIPKNIKVYGSLLVTKATFKAAINRGKSVVYLKEYS